VTGWRDFVDRAIIGLAMTFGVAGTGCGDQETPAARFGKDLFGDVRLSTSPFNDVACSTCHLVTDGGGGVTRRPDRIDPGYDLGNSAHRKSWWGGYETKLLGAINVCVTSFMGAEPFGAESLEVRQIYEYLLDASPDTAALPLPLTVVKTATGLPQMTGDAPNGEGIYRAACRVCHGDPHTGMGRLSKRVGVVPEDTLRAFPNVARAATEEKIRHGRFFGIGGTMPPFSAEVLSDQDIADILAFLGL
jgi:thiosulfate dehydrogenase